MTRAGTRPGSSAPSPRPRRGEVAAAGCRAGEPCHRSGGVHGRGADGELRLDGQAVRAGRAAQNGVLAARLAAAGMTAAPTCSNMPRACCRRSPRTGRWIWTASRPSVTTGPSCATASTSSATRWSITVIGPGCPVHPPRRAPPAAREIQRIRVLVSPTEARVLKQHRPQTGSEAKFSIEFALAAAILAGRVGLARTHRYFVQRPEVRLCSRGSTSTPATTSTPTCPSAPASRRSRSH